MIKTVKGKVITGVTAFALISGGAVLASTDAGQNLHEWYKSKFTESTAKVVTDSTKYAESKAGSLYKQYNDLKTEGTGFINTARSDKTSEGTANINAAKDEHVNSVVDKEAELQAYMGTQFEALYTAAQDIINKTAVEGYKWAEGDLTRKYGADGVKAVGQVETDLTAVKSAAITDLESAITKAKTDLQASLNTNTTKTTADIKKAIDAKIVVLRGQVTQLRDDLVATQKQLIADKAIALENQAKTEMNDVVANINK